MNTELNKIDLDVKISDQEILESNIQNLVIFFQKDNKKLSEQVKNLDEKLDKYISELLEKSLFKGELSECMEITTLKKIPIPKIILVGLGNDNQLPLDERYRRAAATVFNLIKSKEQTLGFLIENNSNIKLPETVSVVTESILLSSYHFSLQSKQDIKKCLSVDIFIDEIDKSLCQNAVEKAYKKIAGVFLARDLVNYPPNYATPSMLASSAETLSNDSNLKVTILDKKAIEDLNMGSFLSVARGSKEEPKFIIMEHNQQKKEQYETVVLVGKGITFDTGGYSIKPASGMYGMKHDMAGGAAVIGAMKAISLLDLPMHVIGLVPTCENRINGEAYLPEDVITASDGTTIEVTNTDAEGRLILADALIYAKKYNPNVIIDIATLTGACAMALAGVASGLFVTDKTLKENLNDAAKKSDERLWNLPMYEEFGKVLKSDIADIKNSNRGGGVGSATMFLKKFVDCKSWAHIDMAGLSEDSHSRPYNKKGLATGYGVRLFVEFIKIMSKK